MSWILFQSLYFISVPITLILLILVYRLYGGDIYIEDILLLVITSIIPIGNILITFVVWIDSLSITRTVIIKKRPLK